MNPVIWTKIGWSILRTLGQVLGTLFMQLLTGKSLKQLLLWPMEKWAKKTKTLEDDKVVEKVKVDWELDNK